MHHLYSWYSKFYSSLRFMNSNSKFLLNIHSLLYISLIIHEKFKIRHLKSSRPEIKGKKVYLKLDILKLLLYFWLKFQSYFFYP